MSNRIESAQVLSFRLKVPAAELPRLPAMLAPDLSLSVEEDGGDAVVSVADSDSYLRFRPIGPESVLTEIFICNDVGGLFFKRVLAALMVRFGGDLHARLLWSGTAAREHGELDEVHIDRGKATEPALAGAAAVLAAEDEAAVEAEAVAEADEPEPHSALDVEVQRSLTQARAHWAEYQRLKGKKS